MCSKKPEEREYLIRVLDDSQCKWSEQQTVRSSPDVHVSVLFSSEDNGVAVTEWHQRMKVDHLQVLSIEQEHSSQWVETVLVFIAMANTWEMLFKARKGPEFQRLRAMIGQLQGFWTYKERASWKSWNFSLGSLGGRDSNCTSRLLLVLFHLNPQSVGCWCCSV